jgi:Tol biopolymer transport system component
MGESAPGKFPADKRQEDRLDSWKEIAEYLSRDVTTVQRWEKREGMPIHRHVHDRMGSVYSSRTELDAWIRSRNLRATQETRSTVVVLAEPPAQSSDVATETPTGVPTATSRTGWRLILPLVATAAVLTVVAGLWVQRTERFWRNPLANARFGTLTDFGGLEQAAAISHDGNFVAFLSDRDGPMDVWVTQVGSGEFHNLTHGSAPDIANPSLRTLAFSPDGSLVTYWLRKQNKAGKSEISVWAVPTLGGEPRPYLEGVAEFDWSRDGARLAYHTPGPGDPLTVSDGSLRPEDRPIFTAPTGLHAHFPLWSPDAAFIYFVQGEPPDKLDIWRIHSDGGVPERITSHYGRVTYPVLLNQRTLVYLADDPDGSGPWLYSLDVERRIPHRLTSDLEQFTSLAASADGRRLVTTRNTSDRTLWRMPIDDSLAGASSSPQVLSSTGLSGAERIPLTTRSGFNPRFGRNYLLYVSQTGTGEGIWKLTDGKSTELWHGEDARVFGGPAISRDGRYVAFSVRRHEQKLLYIMQPDGANARVVADSLDLQGNPEWSPDGQSILTGVTDHGGPHLFRVPVDGRSPTNFVDNYAVDPTWSPDGRFVVYSGPDIGSTFSLKAVTAENASFPLPSLTLTRGARRVTFLPGGRVLVMLRGEIQHKNLWLINLETGAERQLTHLAPEFDIEDFDISPDGREVVIERVQERSNLVLLNLERP